MYRPDRIEDGFFNRYPDRLVTIDSHTQGEPTRLLVGGVGSLPGRTIKEKKDHFESHFDHVRRLLTREPRGHRGIMAAVVTEPVSPQGQFGLFYMDARRYPYLCGHATIGAVATLVDVGALAAVDGDATITVDTPSGPLDAHTRIRNGRVVSVAIDMVPSFVFDTDRKLDVPGFGRVCVDLVCVGGFFAMVSARSVGLDLLPANSHRLITLGMAVIDAANRAFNVYHPERPEVGTVDVTEFYDDDADEKTGRSVVVYGESHMDRSPCGTGTTAKMTLLHHHGRLDPGQVYKNAGPLGTVFEGQVVKRLTIGEFNGIVGQVRGNAQITGYHQFVVDADDPVPEGFLL
ncbi:proline racemase [Desulfosarcina alkanivorans]|jgi:proline racemase|uniref:Proline racemase n=1 Tax=Desulfosarcina alkanivorans TaxID=571177 RepID=A0A5K7YHJ8_9BACT|nr:proline racemase family protein [Desulfosarcina alkanivorans]BBO67865.1 proline racemase [Desulfosarcina alkanivorans]